MAKRYTISDGKLVLTLQEAEEGGFVVSSPLYPELWTQAETLAEAFDNARDALQALLAAKRKSLSPAAAPRKRKDHAA
ncbi:MAG TPA: type II toxin-antitoxin system HicB family antitoxin [Tepidisphaeraceae bacterium]